jgi:hypothetical protein
MNKIHSIIATLLFITGITFLNGCVKGDFDEPPINVPTVDFSSNMTIAGLKQYFVDSMNSTFGPITKDIIIQGKVVSSDETGNIYKKIYLQDTTGGLDIELDSKTLFSTYKLGQRLYIKCKGMYITNYHGVIEIGANYNGSVGRLSSTEFGTYLFKDSFPGNPPTPEIVTIPQFATNLICTLVEIDSVHFLSTDVGLLFSESASTTNRTLQDASGNAFLLRTSNYATFRTDSIPGGTGCIKGILGYYDGDWQLYIRDMNDLK